MDLERENSQPALTANTPVLDNYRNLLAKVDTLCRTIQQEFRQYLSCRPGCAGCCRHISLFMVEAMALIEALTSLPAEQAAAIRARAEGATPDGACPLLDNGLCLLYDARPLICRTHGLPIISIVDGKKVIDFCSLNFQAIDSLPGRAVIELDRLNTTLTAVNALFIAQYYSGKPHRKDRMTIAEALTSTP